LKNSNFFKFSASLGPEIEFLGLIWPSWTPGPKKIFRPISHHFHHYDLTQKYPKIGTYPKSEIFSTMSEDPEFASKSRWKSGKSSKKVQI